MTKENGAREDGVAAFVRARPRLFKIAHRVLGSATEAEDILQDVWLRWQAADRAAVLNPTAFLTTTTTRLAINLGRCARSRREACVGPGWPEPADPRSDPACAVERREQLELAVCVLMESLSPNERAAYILRQAFGYAYSEIADLLRLSQTNVRQLISRARKHLGQGRRASVSSANGHSLRQAFLAATQTGDLRALERVLGRAVADSAGAGCARAERQGAPGNTRSLTRNRMVLLSSEGARAAHFVVFQKRGTVRFTMAIRVPDATPAPTWRP